MPELDAGPLDAIPAGEMKLVEAEPYSIGVYNCEGELYAIEDRCSHDDGPLCEGELDAEDGVAICPRHGARFDIRTGRPLTLPAYLPVETYPVHVVDGIVKVELHAAGS